MDFQALIQIEAADRRLTSEVDTAMAEAVRRSGAWIACRIGCTQCCLGPFPVSQLDVRRLQAGMAALEPEQAARLRTRAAAYAAQIGALDADGLPEGMDDIPCPALDPVTGACELYEWRPITCRTFGPATKTGENSFGICELCYDGVPDSEIRRCAVDVDPGGLEAALIAALDTAGYRGTMIVAAALLADQSPAAQKEQNGQPGRD